MSLRIGFDLDGVLADLASAYRDMEVRLLGADERGGDPPQSPDVADAGPPQHGAGGDEPGEDLPRRRRDEARRREMVWQAIESTEDFWTTLAPLEPGLVGRLAAAAARHRWEVFFLTQRPEAAGQTAQRQTQRWLAAHGFDLPSVLVVRRSRGKLAAALDLDYLVDDTLRNALDVISDSKTRVILVDRTGNAAVTANARSLGIAAVESADEALRILEEATAARESPTLFDRLARMVGWKAGD